MAESWHAAAHARRLAGAALAAALRDSRARTLALVGDLDDAQWRVPQQPGVNLVAWELAHLAWFAEFWILRGPHRLGDDGRVHAGRPARLAGPDALFDSARLAHAQRWQVPLPARAQLLQRLADQLDACLAALPDGDDDAALYFHRLALFHEDMHGEAFTWLRATLAYPAPAGLALPEPPDAPPVRIDGGEVSLGAPAGFAFDNELPAHRVTLPAFEIDARPVRAGEFAAFVDAGGYAQAGLPRAHPARWRRGARGWEQRWFDRWQPLMPTQPVIHVDAFEAEAYARWAGRRLPSAAEWEHAAPHLHWGRGVWEWTASDFAPYPGFQPGPYRDYSLPWFGDHRELRGGAFATDARLHHRAYRNFFQPHRHDVFVGFRTCRSLP